MLVLSFLQDATANTINKYSFVKGSTNMQKNTIQIEDRYTINHSRDFAWEKLNNPDILASCIKGCAFVERISPTQFKAVIRAHIGDIKKDFSINLDVDDQYAPAQYTLGSVVSAGLLGKAQAQAEVQLEAKGEDQCVLHYVATINGSGVLGQALPLIEGAAL
jgi:carbon monoxide dehydrogenase subunit G